VFFFGAQSRGLLRAPGDNKGTGSTLNRGIWLILATAMARALGKVEYNHRILVEKIRIVNMFFPINLCGTCREKYGK
jgi:hypothetical protein